MSSSPRSPKSILLAASRDDVRRFADAANGTVDRNRRVIVPEEGLLARLLRDFAGSTSISRCQSRRIEQRLNAIALLNQRVLFVWRMLCLRILSGELKEFDDVSVAQRAAFSAKIGSYDTLPKIIHYRYGANGGQ